MKKNIKTILILILLGIYLGIPVTSLATNIQENIITNEINETTKENNQGNINITIHFGFKTTQTDFKATLVNNSFTTEPKQITKEDENVYLYFQDVPNGEYQLEIKQKNYIPYQTKVTVNSDITSLYLDNQASINDAILSDNKYGLICLGDINQDGIINEKDENLMMEKINQGTLDTQYDLNGDGIINIVDLSYITLNKNKQEQGVQIKSLLLDQAQIVLSNTTKLAEGNISDLLHHTAQTVSLAPTDQEEISTSNPVSVTVKLETTHATEGVIISPSTTKENNIEEGEFQIEYSDGSAEVVILGNQETPHLLTSITSDTSAIATKEQDGTIVIQLNGQKVIKQITIKVTKTSGNKLADIAQVEFVKELESRIPAPTMNIPTHVRAIPGNEMFTVTWDKQSNITGYQVKITDDKGNTQTNTTVVNSITIQQFNQAKVKNYTEYTIQVQSINKEWNSGFGETVKVTPVPSSVPDAPDNVSVTGGYRSLRVSWKNMKSTKTYTVYYKEKGEQSYQSISSITGTDQIISNLKDNTTYLVYVTGTNEIGTSKPSLESSATTTDINPPVTSNYKLLNLPEGQGKTAHIKSVTYSGGKKPDTEFAIVDDDYTTGWTIQSWDAGGFNNAKPSPIITFDQAYQMDRLVVVPMEPTKYDYFYAKTQYWDESGKSHIINGQFSKKTSSNGKLYYEFNYTEPILATKIQINFALYLAYGDGQISIAEMKFYYYDSIEADIQNLYSDQLHVTLKEEVSNTTIEHLQQRLDTKDPISGEYHPKKELLQKELDMARAILEDQTIQSAISIHTNLAKTYDSHITFKGGLTAMQPLGNVGYAGETVYIYVGNETKKVGDNTPLKLIATQYHAESSSWIKTVTNLKIGKNEVTLPKLQSIDVEKGGSLYIEYTGNNAKESYGVRISGGAKVPFLDLTKGSTEEERKALVLQYVEELEHYVPTLPSLHEAHKEAIGNYEYEQTNCILGATDIVLDHMMYSVSSQQILNGLKGNTVEEKAEQLYQSLQAMDQMIELFYQTKGLSTQTEAGEKNQFPHSKLNIRYQRMFAGAFMYAGGLHIGIEWNSIPGLTKGEPITATEEGKFISGNYFGWGISHEIGHIINEGAYAIAEITNNYFALLSQSKDTNDSVRFQYQDVYQKVTSNEVGRANNVFTQLGMYWQLHLAYDQDGYHFKQYDTYSEQKNNLVYARMDEIARDISQAPQPNGIALTLNGGAEDNFMRLACAATQKNLITFFTRWGLTPNEETLRYIGQFPEETFAIYYMNDNARTYQLEKKAPMKEQTKVVAELIYRENSNKVTISLSHTSENTEAMLGYEIERVETYKDQTIRKAVGFVTADQTEFVDTIESVNNRTFRYEVTAYDQYLNKTETVNLGEVKISHDGSLDKTDWKINTNMTSEQDTQKEAEEQDPCEPKRESAITKVIDKVESSTYIGKAEKENAMITIRLPEVTSITALKYTLTSENAAIEDYQIFVSTDGTNWNMAKEGKFTLKNGVYTAYFNKENDPQMYIYDASYVKLVALNSKNKEIAISEIDILGPTSDNIELLSVEGSSETSIGILKQEYKSQDFVIPKGSLIFTGTYKGNPAYNAILLWDENNQIVGGMDQEGYLHAKQLFFAHIPEHGDIGETSNGTWIYWIEPNEFGTIDSIPQTVRAELYRVDQALVLSGERLVSDTKTVSLPEILPEIEIESRGE